MKVNRPLTDRMRAALVFVAAHDGNRFEVHYGGWFVARDHTGKGHSHVGGYNVNTGTIDAMIKRGLLALVDGVGVAGARYFITQAGREAINPPSR